MHGLLPNTMSHEQRNRDSITRRWYHLYSAARTTDLWVAFWFFACFFFCQHIPCLHLFSFCLYTPKNWTTRPDSSLCSFQMYLVFGRDALHLSLREVCFQRYTVVNHPQPALIPLQECLEPGRLQKPGLPAAAPGNLHTFPRALITCLPLTA